MSNAIQDAIAYCRKEVESAFEMESSLVGISTGSLAGDIVTGIGGFPRQRVTEVSGWESGGKTTLCLSAAAHAQRNGHFVVYLDPECALDLSYANKLKFDYQDETKGLYATPRTFEDTIKIVDKMVEADVDLVIVDSIPAMVPEVEMEGKIEDAGQIAHRARLLSGFLPRITKALKDKKTALVFINQMRYKVDTGFGAKRGMQEQAPGGAALRFYSSLRLQVSIVRKGVIKRDEVDAYGEKREMSVASIHNIEAIKNKIAVPYRSLNFMIRFDAKLGVFGIDNLFAVLQVAKGQGIIKVKSGGHCNYTSTTNPELSFAIQGDDQVYQHLLNSPALVSEIRDAVKKLGFLP